jgi:hypothetical protein
MPDDTDWKAVAVQLAAIDHRACSIVEAADKIVEYLDSIGLVKYAGHRKLEMLLTEYRIARGGQ